jgi:hypothetical protein
MKTNHGAVINKRMKENYGDLLKCMSPEDKAWAEKFEKLEYAIERGFGAEATRLARELNPSVSKEAIQRIRDDVAAKDRCNPSKVDRYTRRNDRDRKTDRAPSSNLYEAYDWHRNAGTMQAKDEGDSEVEKGITTNPEDALIGALDAAAVHGVSLEAFINNPKYHTQERKAGRPKKVQE